MKTFGLFLAMVLLIISSCKSPYSGIAPKGEYLATGKDYKYVLKLDSDGSFKLEERIQDGRPSCVGKWKTEQERFIRLTCDSIKNLSEMLSNGYMTTQSHTVIIINKRALLYKGVKLRKSIRYQ